MSEFSVLEERVDDPQQPFTEHLVELRSRLIVSLIALGLGTAVAYHWSSFLLSWLARPAGGLVFTAPAEAFMTRLKVAAFAGFLLTLPILLTQAWLFVARAMKPEARRAALRLLPLSYLLFLFGVALALCVVVPTATRFLLSYGSEDIRPMMTLSAYMAFATQLSAAFGCVFQVPLVLLALGRLGVVNRSGCASRRPYIYLLAFIGAAFLSPGPDVFSQVALALPFVLLFELTLLVM